MKEMTQVQQSGFLKMDQHLGIMLRRIEVCGVRACMVPWETAAALVHTMRGGSGATAI